MPQDFGTYDISSISVPVIGVKGTQDDLLGGQEDDFFGQLSPGISDASTLIEFDDASGGALHDQVGSPFILAARLFAKLDPIFSRNVTGENPVGTCEMAGRGTERKAAGVPMFNNNAVHFTVLSTMTHKS